ncbi:Putative peptidoglycan binding domain-containing protein [Clostridium cavendishii DSM 21758]|uniref:Putative peptidoglycan binding domain-containing protein n=1 Tax=Clostridium cavendishii DSM 21758 TaxID=1121302 RepID=A0A1M6IRV1_9CLOT|nr:peptidoglycan-binding domain-containing protein [Clostridium cavendishii]SHJ37201.1 Putative peptidoglycan binding domain-containing protein [Clostridium cavendishii DSM 21758]
MKKTSLTILLSTVILSGALSSANVQASTMDKLNVDSTGYTNTSSLTLSSNTKDLSLTKEASKDIQSNIVIQNVGESKFVDEILTKNKPQKLTLESSNKNVILPIEEQGRFLAVGIGESTITLKSDGFEKTIKVKVNNNNTITRQPRSLQPSDILRKAEAMINVRWTPRQDLVGWRGNYVFKANQQQTGIPYSQWTQTDENSFIAALGYSDFYSTVSSNGRSMPRYGSDCSGFVSFAYGLSRHNTWQLEEEIGSTLSRVNISDLTAGDGVVTNTSGAEHTFLIASRNGSNFTCYEQTPYKAMVTSWSSSQLSSKGYIGFRKAGGSTPTTVPYPGYLLSTALVNKYDSNVKILQEKLNSLGYNAGTADGYFGNNTKAAVIRFQKAHSLDQDGIVGPQTWNALFK